MPVVMLSKCNLLIQCLDVPRARYRTIRIHVHDLERQQLVTLWYMATAEALQLGQDSLTERAWDSSCHLRADVYVQKRRPLL